MGSDRSPKILFEAVQQAAKILDPSCLLVVIATHSAINDIKQLYAVDSANSPSILFHPVSDTIAMSEDPIAAVSRKKESSLVVGIRLLKKQRIDAFVSLGNTGALVTSAALNLPKLPGVQRPALLVVLPTMTGSVAVLDVGGSVASKAHHLVQYAYMGAAYQRCNEGIETPAVGLLNIGVEAQKGTSTVRQAYQTLQDYSNQDTSIKFVGNVEGRDLFQGKIDVLVTDGFTGNVLLKTTEGVSSFIFDYIQEALENTPEGKLREAFQDLKRYFSRSEYPGAILCGVEGIVIKCHGDSSTKALINGIKGAATLVEKQLIAKLKAQLEIIMKDGA